MFFARFRKQHLESLRHGSCPSHPKFRWYPGGPRCTLAHCGRRTKPAVSSNSKLPDPKTISPFRVQITLTLATTRSNEPLPLDAREVQVLCK
uniref:Uncharacterized protein n=1 Tax=Physcomitrium patens TaxID=3218 RepID=A0A2K1J0G9_PHYPA|nr:hypothetical protein PHYPA_022920 [Physcomitrium patens]